MLVKNSGGDPSEVLFPVCLNNITLQTEAFLMFTLVAFCAGLTCVLWLWNIVLDWVSTVDWIRTNNQFPAVQPRPEPKSTYAWQHSNLLSSSCATLNLNCRPAHRMFAADDNRHSLCFQAVLFYFVLGLNYGLRYLRTKLQDRSFSV